MSPVDYLKTWSRERGNWGLDMTVDSSFGPARAVVFWPDRVIARIDGEARAYPLPPSVLVLLTHLVDAGERLTLGRCPDCEGAKELRRTEAVGTDLGALVYAPGVERWRVADGIDAHGRLTWVRPCPTCSEPVECETCKACKGRGKVVTRYAEIAPGRRVPVASHPCIPCEGLGSQPGPGVPTGLLRVSAAEALLLARGFGRLQGPGLECDEPGCELLAMWANSSARGVCDTHCPRSPLGVYADTLLQSGDPLGRWLALWLSGAPCEVCKGSNTGKMNGLLDLRHVACPACHGDGTALGQRVGEMVRPRKPGPEQQPARGGLPASAAGQSAP